MLFDHVFDPMLVFLVPSKNPAEERFFLISLVGILFEHALDAHYLRVELVHLLFKGFGVDLPVVVINFSEYLSQFFKVQV